MLANTFVMSASATIFPRAAGPARRWDPQVAMGRRGMREARRRALPAKCSRLDARMRKGSTFLLAMALGLMFGGDGLAGVNGAVESLPPILIDLKEELERAEDV